MEQQCFFRAIIKSKWNQSPLMSQRVLAVRSALSVLLTEASPLPDICSVQKKSWFGSRKLKLSVFGFKQRAKHPVFLKSAEVFLALIKHCCHAQLLLLIPNSAVFVLVNRVWIFSCYDAIYYVEMSRFTQLF